MPTTLSARLEDAGLTCIAAAAADDLRRLAAALLARQGEACTSVNAIGPGIAPLAEKIVHVEAFYRAPGCRASIGSLHSASRRYWTAPCRTPDMPPWMNRA